MNNVEYLYAGISTCTILNGVFDSYMQTGYSLCTFTGHFAPVMSLDFHPNKEDLICSCDGDGEIRYWSINNRSCTRVFKVQSTASVYCLISFVFISVAELCLYIHWEVNFLFKRLIPSIYTLLLAQMALYMKYFSDTKPTFSWIGLFPNLR